MNRLLSPDFWIAVSSLLGVVGIVLAITGIMGDIQWAKTAGLLLVAPIILGGFVLALVVIPILIIANRRHASTDEDDRNMHNGEN